MFNKSRFGRYFWVIGGLALGGLGGLVIGFLVFWVFPTLQKAHSPFGEFEYPPIVVRFLKDSPVAKDAPILAAQLRDAWYKTLTTLGLPEKRFPPQIYLYLYPSPQELGLGISTRLEEEKTLVAVADIVIGRPIQGELGRLACALAFGRPGNLLIPRGLALYLNDPEHPWAAEAWTWKDLFSISEIWDRAASLLPKDPWEDLYFQINAPWVGATLTLEKMRAVITALSEANPRGARVGEAFAGAMVQWILKKFGSAGLECFWQANTWEKAAKALGKDPQLLAQDFLGFLEFSFETCDKKEALLALKELHSGYAERALEIVANVDNETAREIRGLAYLALGRVDEALPLLMDKIPGLEKLADAPILIHQQLILVGGQPENTVWLQKASLALDRASLIWPGLTNSLPDRLVFYVAEKPEISTPWGISWVNSPEEIPNITARIALEAVSPRGVPDFSTLVEGLVLWFVDPERDFRAEAKSVLLSERWVSLSQPLFGVYPKEIAEAEAGAFVTYVLERYGPQKLRAIWNILQEGASIFRATELVFGVSFYTFEAEFQQWIKQP